MLTLLQVLSDNGGEIHLLYLLSHWMEIPKIRQSLGLVGLKFTRFQVLSDKGGEIQSTFCRTSDITSTGCLGEENQAKPGFGGFKVHPLSGSLRQRRRKARLKNPRKHPMILLDFNLLTLCINAFNKPFYHL